MIKNYRDSWSGDETPGKGNIAYDRRHSDVVIYGFMRPKMIIERDEKRMILLEGAIQECKDEIKEYRKELNKLKKKQ